MVPVREGKSTRRTAAREVEGTWVYMEGGMREQ